ncbi:family 16 glycosylhydrolase [Marinagarivorans cellulosilyticus]|uniref:GH16 domain-containing protein n=1 Tax=Marinagarivorans cellulosilyticus TaxID=2721545 RepID=A0AAN1WEP1_9GAMM|nr:family 16 glycosylhydrolase [Marinagarivorans cellulosilyticus]BCD96208.1 hypothetical protein MARGE09_P0407 [Marinagarivorans cellulosilyticus]
MRRGVFSLKLFTLLASIIGAGWLTPAQAKPYKGAEIFVADPQLYGKFVIRMQAAKGSGVISNFFLWKDGSEMESIFWEEVDVEVFGKNNATSWQSNIITGLGSKDYSEDVHGDGNFADQYHTFTIEWTPNQVRWLVDGKVARTTAGGQAGDLVSPAQVRLNFWPPDNTAWVGPWNDNILPLHMFVNWVELYSYSNGQFELEWRDDFDYFDNGRWGKADWTFAENRADFSPNNAIVKNGYLILAMTREGQEGYNGTPPTDNGPIASSSTARSSSSSAASSNQTQSSIAVSSSSQAQSSSVTVASSLPASSSSSADSGVSLGAFNLWGLTWLLMLWAVAKVSKSRKP